MDSDAPSNSGGLDDADVAEQLSSIEERMAAAWVAGDRSLHERVLADDWSVIDATGRVLSKAEMLEEAFSGDREITSGKIDEISVRPFGDLAVVTGRTRIAGRLRGADMEVALRFTDVFARRGGDWQVVASQATLLNE